MDLQDVVGDAGVGFPLDELDLLLVSLSHVFQLHFLPLQIEQVQVVHDSLDHLVVQVHVVFSVESPQDLKDVFGSPKGLFSLREVACTIPSAHLT